MQRNRVWVPVSILHLFNWLAKIILGNMLLYNSNSIWEVFFSAVVALFDSRHDARFSETWCHVEITTEIFFSQSEIVETQSGSFYRRLPLFILHVENIEILNNFVFLFICVLMNMSEFPWFTNPSFLRARIGNVDTNRYIY